MNVRVVMAVVLIALALAYLELSWMTHDEPVVVERVSAPQASTPMEAPEHDPALDVNIEVSASPILTR